MSFFVSTGLAKSRFTFEERPAPANWASAFRATAGKNWTPNPHADDFVPTVEKRARESSEIDTASCGLRTPGESIMRSTSSIAFIPHKADRTLNVGAVGTIVDSNVERGESEFY